MTGLIIAALMAVLLCLPEFFHARRARRLAWARLKMTESLIELESLMLEGETVAGQPVHDVLHRNMNDLAHCKQFHFDWFFWLKVGRLLKRRDERKQLAEELGVNPRLKKIDEDFSVYVLRAFRNSRPYVSCLFILYVGFIRGMATAFVWLLLASIKALFHVRATTREVRKVIELQREVGALYREEVI